MRLIHRGKNSTPETFGVRDGATYEMTGVPTGATASELARFCREISWVAIPLRRIPQRDAACWWLTAAGPPKEPGARWGQTTVLITALSDEKRFKQSEPKRAHKALDRERQKMMAPSKEPRTEQDLLQAKDPWASYVHSPKSSQSIPSQAAAESSVDMRHDPRISALTARIESIEQGHSRLSTKVEGIDNKLGALSNNIEQQFQSVLQGLANLQAHQEEAGKRHRSS